jgi:GT2 family glycosyltransferase
MISVIIPTHNDGHFLPTALASCLNQTIPVEIVLVDDASTTPLPEDVLQFIADHREIVTQVRHGSNCGLSAARNTGIAHARFDLIIPLDADDWFLPGTLAPLTSALTADVDIAYGNVMDSGKLYEPVKRQLQRADFLEDTPLFCGSLFRKTVWQTVGGYTVRQGPHYEDWNFWCKAFKAGFRFHYTPVTVYEHRSRPDSMLRQLHQERAKYVRVATEPLLEPEPTPPTAAVPPESAVAPAPPDAPHPPRPESTAVARIQQLMLEVGHELTRLAEARTPLGRDEPRPTEEPRQPPEPRKSPELVAAHATIGRLMVELQRAKAELADARNVGKPPALVSVHATIGQLLERRPANDPST